MSELAFEISQIAQVTRAMFEKDSSKHLKRINGAIKYAHDNRASICLPKFDLYTPHVVEYSDAVFTTNIEVSSQLKRIV